MAHNIFSRKEEKPKRILVAVNGSPADDEAMRLAYSYAVARKGKGRRIAIDVVYVVEVPQALALETPLNDRLAQGEKALDHAEAIAGDMGLAVEVEATIIKARSAGAAIVDMSRNSAANMIVMAVEYNTKLGELDLGRTVPYVLKHSPCRVWVCRSPMPNECDPEESPATPGDQSAHGGHGGH